MSPKQKKYFTMYLLIAAAYIWSLFMDSGNISSFLKPLLLMPLMGAVLVSQISLKKLLMTALVFCWVGDIMLLFAEIGEVYFISGLVSFLIGHVFYIFLFAKMKSRNTHLKRWNQVVLLIILFYLVIFYYWMGPHLGSMLVPVMIYAIVISCMLYFAWLVYATSANTSGFILLTGALMFVISDSVLAVNKFYIALPLSGFLIMLTYIAAQVGIVYGCLISKMLK